MAKAKICYVAKFAKMSRKMIMEPFWTYNASDVQHGYFYTRIRWEMGMNCDIRVFVYGTLKGGCSNHHYLSGSQFIGTGKTVQKYALYTDGRIPFVIEDQAVSHISGELYSVDQIVLHDLDRLEGHPNWYKRKEVEIAPDEAGTPEIKAWLYFYPYPTGKLMPNGVFNNHF